MRQVFCIRGRELSIVVSAIQIADAIPNSKYLCKELDCLYEPTTSARVNSELTLGNSVCLYLFVSCCSHVFMFLGSCWDSTRRVECIHDLEGVSHDVRR